MSIKSEDEAFVSTELNSLIEYLENNNLKDRTQKVMCPQCSHYIDIAHLPCGCILPKEVNLFEGCSDCGMQFGQGAFRVRGVECTSCGYELDFFEPYPFSEGSILLREDDRDSNLLTFITLFFFTFIVVSLGVISNGDWLSKKAKQIQKEAKGLYLDNNRPVKNSIVISVQHKDSTHAISDENKRKGRVTSEKTYSKSSSLAKDFKRKDSGNAVRFDELADELNSIWNRCQKEREDLIQGYLNRKYRMSYKEFVARRDGLRDACLEKRTALINEYLHEKKGR